MSKTIEGEDAATSSCRNSYRESIQLSSVAAEIRPFMPNSAGTIEQRVRAGLSAAGRTPSLMADILDSLDAVPITPIQSFCADDITRAKARTLESAFNRHRSDKSSPHNYHLLYAAIIDALKDQDATLLEIGLGTNDTTILSNMGEAGRPGASLFAFSDVLPHAAIFGADIDRKCLFRTDRITIHHVDQSDPESFSALTQGLGTEQFGIIIDDGLHAPDANLVTLRFALTHLSASGWFVVEDIPKVALPIWRTLYGSLNRRFHCWIVKARISYLFVLRT